MTCRHSAALAAAVWAFATTAAGAADITYQGIDIVGLDTVALSVTTDGTLGVISEARFVSYSVAVSGLSTFSFASPSGPLTGSAGDDLVATATALTYDLGDSISDNFLEFYNPAASPHAAFVLEGGFLGPAGEYIAQAEGFSGVPSQFSAGAGVVTFATVSAVPEPSGWAFVLPALAAVGGASRFRDRRSA